MVAVESNWCIQLGCWDIPSISANLNYWKTPWIHFVRVPNFNLILSAYPGLSVLFCVINTREFSQEKAKKGWEMSVLMILATTVHETWTIAGKPGHWDNVPLTGIVPVKPGGLECLNMRYGFLVLIFCHIAPAFRRVQYRNNWTRKMYPYCPETHVRPFN